MSFVLSIGGVALADEPQDWPGLAKEKFGGVALGDSADAAVKALGKPTNKTKAESEAATGTFVSTWTFTGDVQLTMSADKAAGPFVVRNLDVKGASKLKNVEGISIGSSVADVKKAYGKNLTHPDDKSWLVGTPYNGMLFTVDKDQVVEVFVGPMAE